MQKKCISCQIEKDSTEFHNRKSAKDGLQHRCKICAIKRATEHYLHHKHDFKCRTKKLTDLYKHCVGVIKEGYGCFNCKLNNHKCLDFHHTNPIEKDFNVSSLTSGKSTTNIVTEINKCVVVCANCHRLIHYGDLETDISKQCKISLESFQDTLSKFKKDFGISNEIHRPRLPGFIKKENLCKCGKIIAKRFKTCKKCYNATQISWPSQEELILLLSSKSLQDVSLHIKCSEYQIKKRCNKLKINWKQFIIRQH